MEKITTRSERLKDIRAVEILARKGYMEDINTFRNFKIKDTIEKIKEDEDKHINILTELILLLE